MSWFGGGFDKNKLKANLSMSTQRIKLLCSKASNEIKIERREIANLVSPGCGQGVNDHWDPCVGLLCNLEHCGHPLVTRQQGGAFRALHCASPKPPAPSHCLSFLPAPLYLQLKDRKFDKARIKVESFIRKEREKEAWEILDLMADLLVARVNLIASEKQCEWLTRRAQRGWEGL